MLPMIDLIESLLATRSIIDNEQQFKLMPDDVAHRVASAVMMTLLDSLQLLTRHRLP